MPDQKPLEYAKPKTQPLWIRELWISVAAGSAGGMVGLAIFTAFGQRFVAVLRAITVAVATKTVIRR